VIPDVTLVDRHVDLVEEGFDVGVLIARQMRSASIVTRRLTTGHMTVCATPAYLQKHGAPVRPEQLQDHPSLSLPSEYGGDERVFTSIDGKGEVRVRPTNAIVANNTEMLRQFALLGMGIAILPSYLIGRDLERGRLVRLFSDYRLPQIEVTIAYPSRHHLPAKVRTFIDHLVEHFNKMSGAQAADAPGTFAAAQAGRTLDDDMELVPAGYDDGDAPMVSRTAKASPVVSRKVTRSRLTEQASPI
jgi:DNA-binding transcriptional LysR family regulator